MKSFFRNLGLLLIIISGGLLVYFMQKDFTTNLSLGLSVGGIILGMLLHITLNRLLEDI